MAHVRLYSSNDLKTLARSWQEAELDPNGIAPVTAALTRLDELAAEAKQLDDAPSVKEIGELFARGESNLADAVTKHAIATAAKQPLSASTSQERGGAIIQAARSAILRHAVESLSTVAQAFRTERRKVETHTAKLNSLLTDISTPDGAMQAGPKASAAWLEREDLGRRTAQAFSTIYMILRRNGVDTDLLAPAGDNEDHADKGKVHAGAGRASGSGSS